MSSSAELLNETSPEISSVIGHFTDIEECLDFVGVISPCQRIAEELVEIAGLLRCFGIERLSAPDTQRFVFGRLLLTARAFERRDVFLVGLFDFQPMHFSVLPVCRIFAKTGDIAGCVFGAALASLSILDERLRCSLSGKPRGVGFPERSRRDRLGDVCTLTRVLEHLQITSIAYLRTVRELAPHRRTAIIAAGMFGEPARDVWDAGDEIDRTLTGLAIDGDTQAGLSVRDIADGQILEFTATQSSVELEGNGRLIAGITTFIEHGLDICIPSKHLSRIGHRIVVRGERRRDPCERVRDFVIVCESLPEDTQGDAIVLIRFRRVVKVIFSVYPADDLLGSIPVFDSIDESSGSQLGHSNIVSQQLPMTIPTVCFTEQAESIREFKQRLTVGIARAALAGFEFLTEHINLPLGVSRFGHTIRLNGRDYEDVVQSRLLAYSYTLTIYFPYHKFMVGNDPDPKLMPSELD